MKLIIDIPEKVVTAIQNGEDYRFDIHTAIAQGIPCEEKPQGDSISRDALEEVLKECAYSNDSVNTWIMKDEVLGMIDNAPSAEPEKVLIANVTFDEDKLKEIIQTEVIDKIKSGELVLESERQQGEWKITYGYPHKVYCDKCFKTYAQENWEIWKDGSLPRNFCPNCGADMAKGGAV